MILLRGLVVWVVIMLAEVLHGMARVALLQPYVGDFRARQTAVFTGSVIFLCIAILFVRWLRAERVYQLLGVGLLWSGLTFLFEILFGRLVMRYSWERLASDYNLLEGGLLPIGLFVLLMSPLIAARVRDAV